MITLYKRNKDKIQEWTIEVQGDKYRSIEGFQGGAKTESKWTVAKPKNIGKSNETTGEEQAEKEAEAKIQKKKDKGYVEEITDEASDDIFNVMLAHDYTKPRGQKVVNYVWSQGDSLGSQPKLDGIRNYITKDGMFYRSNKPLIIPHIYDTVKPLFDKYPDLILDGELYNHDLKDDFNKIVSLVRKKSPSADEIKDIEKHIQFHTYDLYLNDVDWFFQRNDLLTLLVDTIDNPVFQLVETRKCNTQEELDDAYGEYLSAGYEGQMVRTDQPYIKDRSINLLKRKEFLTEEFEIIDVLEGVGNRSGMMGKFVLKVGDNTFEANSRGSFEFYTELLERRTELIGKQATVRFQNYTPNGIPRFGYIIAIRDYE